MNDSFDHCYIKKILFFCISVYYKTLPSLRQFLKRRGRKHARQVPPRNCGIAISRKARARQNARLPPRPPTPLQLQHCRVRRSRTTRDISKDRAVLRRDPPRTGRPYVTIQRTDRIGL